MSAEGAQAASATRATEDLPLVVDLDGTLFASDLLIECYLALTAAHPIKAFTSLAHLRHGRAQFKSALAAFELIEVGAAPLNAPVVDYLVREKARGRAIYLVTASDDRLAQAAARRFDFIDQAFGSDGVTNLSGRAKAEHLVERFGAGKFEYIGNSHADLAVWAVAGRRVATNASAGLVRALRRLDPEAQVLGGSEAGDRRRAMVRALRPHQWAKNALVFVPLIAAHRFDLASAAPTIASFVALCMAASSAYLVNDLLDLQHDRTHRTKRNRPIASGRASLLHAAGLAPALALGAAAIATISPFLLLTVFIYYVSTMVYSMKIKRMLLIDIFTLSFLYCVRVGAGSAASQILPSPWLVSFCLFLFLGLATIKRLTELIGLGVDKPLSGRAYQRSDIQPLAALATAAGFSAAIVLSLYINSPMTAELYARPFLLWLLCPIFLFWNMRMLLLSMRDQVHDDPLVFALTDKTSVIIVFMCAVVLAAAGPA